MFKIIIKRLVGRLCSKLLSNALLVCFKLLSNALFDNNLIIAIKVLSIYLLLVCFKSPLAEIL